MRKLLTAGLIGMLAVSPSFAGGNSIKIAPLNPAFIKYIHSHHHSGVIKTPDGHIIGGLIPNPIVLRPHHSGKDKNNTKHPLGLDTPPFIPFSERKLLKPKTIVDNEKILQSIKSDLTNDLARLSKSFKNVPATDNKLDMVKLSTNPLLVKVGKVKSPM